jgi:hypothetical protein
MIRTWSERRSGADVRLVLGRGSGRRIRNKSRATSLPPCGSDAFAFEGRKPTVHRAVYAVATAVAFCGIADPTLAQEIADRVEIVRATVNFARGTYGKPVHVRTAGAVLGLEDVLQRESAFTLGAVESAMACEARPGANHCRWTGAGSDGGTIADITKLEFTSTVDAIVVYTAVQIRQHLAVVDFQDWRLQLKRVDERRWQLVGATLIGES